MKIDDNEKLPIRKLLLPVEVSTLGPVGRLFQQVLFGPPQMPLVAAVVEFEDWGWGSGVF